MMTIRWSWIFILYSLLVRLGSAAIPDDNHIVDEILPRAGIYHPDLSRMLNLSSSKPQPQPKKPNVGAIVGGVLGGLALVALLGWYFISRKRRIHHVEEGVKSPGLKDNQGGWLDPKSQFSPDEKNGGKFSRLKDVLGRRKRPPLESILPSYHVAFPTGSTNSINVPPPAVPNHAPRYPSILERGTTKKRPAPPPLEGYPDPSRVPVSESIRSIDSAGGQRTGRRKLQVPPKALVVTTPGRPLPGLAAISARSAGLRTPKSPSRRRSWFAKHPFKHPFIPVRSVDNTLRFPPGSPLYPGNYQPSRQHLEARISARSPRIEGGTPRSGTFHGQYQQPETARQRPDSDEYEDPGSTKQMRLMEALKSADAERPRTPTQNGSRTAIPPRSARHPLGSARFLPEPPTTSYI